MGQNHVFMCLISFIMIGLYVFKTDPMIIHLDPLILVDTIVTMWKKPDFGPFWGYFGPPMANSGVPLPLIGSIVIGLYVLMSNQMMIHLDSFILVDNIVTMWKTPAFGPFHMANSGVQLPLIGFIVIGLYVLKSDPMMIHLHPLILVDNIVPIWKHLILGHFGPN